MSRSFLVDANLPIALARLLTDLGYPSQHVHDLSLGASEDLEVWRAASALGAVIMSKDVDFAHLVRSGGVGPAVVWVRVGNARRDALLARVVAEITVICALLYQGERLIELR